MSRKRLQRSSEDPAASAPLQDSEQKDAVANDGSDSSSNSSSRKRARAVAEASSSGGGGSGGSPAASPSASSYLRLSVPPHRLSPLRAEWLSLCAPIVEHMRLQIRYNTRRRCVELRVRLHSAQRLLLLLCLMTQLPC